MSCPPTPGRARFKRGDTFEAASRLDVEQYDGQPVTDLTGWTGRCMLRTAGAAALVAELEFEWLDAAQRLYRIYHAGSTSAWPVALVEMDIELTSPDGYVISTSKTQFSIEKGVTYD